MIYVCKGKDADTVGSFFIDLLCHHGDPGKIKGACCDMSPAYIKGIGEYFENAQITFDKFHIMMIVNNLDSRESLTSVKLKCGISF